MIINTPDWDLSNISVSDDIETNVTTVYEPAEDTFLMLDTLQLDLEQTIRSRLFQQNKSDDDSSNKDGSILVVELGSGAGLLTTAVAKALHGAHCIAVDINPAACHATVQTCKLNGIQADVIHGDLLSWMKQPKCTETNDVYGPIDVLLFNPPYVRGPNGESAPLPTVLEIDPNDARTQDKMMSTMIDAAWLGGGPNGIDVLKRALHQAADLLSERGVFYLLMIDYNYIALVKDEMTARRKRDHQIFEEENSEDFVLLTTFGKNPKNKPLACLRLLSRRVPGERLAVYRVYRPHVLDCVTD